MGSVWDAAPSAIQEHGYAVIAAVTFLETTSLLAFLVPGLATLAAGGFLAANGQLDLGMAWGCAIAGTVAGDQVSYLIGRSGAMWRRLPRRMRARIVLGGRIVGRQPRLMLLFIHFPAYLRTAIPMAMGAARVGWTRWLAMDVSAAATFTGTFLVLGWLAGRLTGDVGDALRLAGFAVPAVLVGMAIAWRVRRQRRPVTRRMATSPRYSPTSASRD